MQKIIIFFILTIGLSHAENNLCKGGIAYLEELFKKAEMDMNSYGLYAIPMYDENGNKTQIDWQDDIYLDLSVRGTGSAPAKSYYKVYDKISSKDVKLIKKLKDQVNILKEILKVQEAATNYCNADTTIHTIRHFKSFNHLFHTKMHKYNYKYFYNYKRVYKKNSQYSSTPSFIITSKTRFKNAVMKFEKYVNQLEVRGESAYDSRIKNKQKMEITEQLEREKNINLFKRSIESES